MRAFFIAVSTNKRVRGRALQTRRQRVWAKDPCCAECRKLTEYPSGFELDHIVAIDNGGPDTYDNLQVLCHVCHERKTASDLGRRYRRAVGEDGWPVQ